MGDISKDIASDFTDNRLKAFINIKYTSNWLYNQQVDFFKPYGLSPQQYNVLRILRGANEKIKVQVVKDRMIEKSPNTTRLMDKLLSKKMIERARSPKDKRVVFVGITKYGLSVLSEIDNKFTSWAYLENLTEEEAKTLSDLLDKLR